MSEIILPPNIFNTENFGSSYTPIFMGEKPGLFDTINKCHPEVFKLYKLVKLLDWDENLFSYLPCKTEFKTCSSNEYDAMISTLAWQWETDSVAARSLMAVLSPFLTSAEAHCAYTSIQANENVHALTYSEIVRTSFDDPNNIVKDILSRKDAFARLKIVADTFEEALTAAHQYALGVIKDTQETYEKLFRFLVVNYVMERAQFMPSFAVTFSMANSGKFLPIGSALQKICQDEFQVHVKMGMTVLDIEMRTERGLMAFLNNRQWIIDLIEGVRSCEHVWSNKLLPNGKELTGLNSTLLNAYEDHCITDVYKFFRIPEKNPMTRHPIPWIEEWIDISKRQGSPQEIRNGEYFMGGFTDNLGNRVIEIDLG